MKLIVSSTELKEGLERFPHIAKDVHWEGTTIDVGLLHFVKLQDWMNITLKVVRRGADYHILTAGVGE